MLPSSRLSVIAFVVAVVGLACGGDDAAENNGVNDVKKACEIRVAFANLESERCRNCIAAAPAPSCDCESFKEWAALCKAQGDARNAEASCSIQIDQCVVDCKKDCACVDRCYDASAACRRVTAARDGCVADVCASACR